ncbi:MAG: hypothetical protein HN474_10345 [Nitrospina sp.]|jgi:hypothetical protein|nr:hypothetical protein [Nitrospina sp.]
MKKLAIALITAVSVLCLSTLAFAGSLAPGASMTCNNANSIKLETAGSNATDRTNANFVVWKSSNFTTIPITLGPSDTSGLENNSSGNSKDTKFKCKDTTQCIPGAIDSAAAKVRPMWTKGRKSVTLTGQSNFSRGDSIGDISGEVRITNIGSVKGNVTCG